MPNECSPEAFDEQLTLFEVMEKAQGSIAASLMFPQMAEELTDFAKTWLEKCVELGPAYRDDLDLVQKHISQKDMAHAHMLLAAVKGKQREQMRSQFIECAKICASRERD